MTQYVHTDVLDNGLNEVKNDATHIILLTAYTESYSTANGANKVASCTVATGDFAISNAVAASSRKITAAVNGRSMGNALQDVNPGTGMHVAIVDSATSRVLIVTEETLDQTIFTGNPMTMDADIVYTLNGIGV